MNKILNVTGIASKSRIKAAECFVNLYAEWEQGVALSANSSVDAARRNRASDVGRGTLVKISRNTDGDFSIEAVEVF